MFPQDELRKARRGSAPKPEVAVPGLTVKTSVINSKQLKAFLELKCNKSINSTFASFCCLNFCFQRRKWCQTLVQNLAARRFLSKTFIFHFVKKCTISGEDQDGRGFYDRHPLSIDCFYSRPALRGKKISSFFCQASMNQQWGRYFVPNNAFSTILWANTNPF